MEDYYQQLIATVTKKKAGSKERGKKKEFKYLGNTPNKRVTYCRRSESLLLAVGFCVNIGLNVENVLKCLKC